MKVEELVERLKMCDQWADVVFECKHDNISRPVKNLVSTLKGIVVLSDHDIVGLL